MERASGIIGFIALLAIAFSLSTDRRAIRWKSVAAGIGVQILCALLVLKGEWLSQGFQWFRFPLWLFLFAIICQWVFLRILQKRPVFSNSFANPFLKSIIALQILVLLVRFNLILRFFELMKGIVNQLIAYSGEGARFVFGALATEQGGKSIGFVFAFQVLPTIIFVASIFAILYYLGIMQIVVHGMSKVMTRLLGCSGAESVSVAASIFMGQTEAPLTIRPYLAEMTRSELMTIMTAGMAHVSGGIMAAYVLVAHVDVVHLLTAVIMTAPGSIMISKIMVPETESPRTGSSVNVNIPRTDVNLVDAAARGAFDGLQLAINVAGMLIAFIALVALVNGILSYSHQGILALALHISSPEGFLVTLAKHVPASLQDILGVIFRPVAWTMGVNWRDTFLVGNLLGTRMVLNELVSFLQLGQVAAELSHRSFVISTFALCGFANFASIAIQVGGIGALAPSRRHDLAALGVKAMIAGTLANFLSATIAGLML